MKMALRTRPEDDDWQHIKDAKKRKQAQDRLAQRARRTHRCTHLKNSILISCLGKRLREMKGQGNDSQPLATRSTRPLDSESLPASNEPEVPHLALEVLKNTDQTPQSCMRTPLDSQISDMDELNLTILDTGPVTACDPDSELLPANLYSPLPSPTTTQLVIPLNVFTALFLNGNILGLICGAELAGKSLPSTPSTPIPLRPTYSQLTTVHYQWIDRFPFPKLRDSLIRLQGVIDQQDFLNDIFVMPSFQIESGAESWDPRAWKMEHALVILLTLRPRL